MHPARPTSARPGWRLGRGSRTGPTAAGVERIRGSGEPPVVTADPSVPSGAPASADPAGEPSREPINPIVPPARTDRSEQAARSEQTGRSEQAARSEQTGRSEQAARSEQAGRSGRTDPSDPLGKTEQRRARRVVGEPAPAAGRSATSGAGRRTVRARQRGTGRAWTGRAWTGSGRARPADPAAPTVHSEPVGERTPTSAPNRCAPNRCAPGCSGPGCSDLSCRHRLLAPR